MSSHAFQRRVSQVPDCWLQSCDESLGQLQARQLRNLTIQSASTAWQGKPGTWAQAAAFAVHAPMQAAAARAIQQPCSGGRQLRAARRLAEVAVQLRLRGGAVAETAVRARPAWLRAVQLPLQGGTQTREL